MEKAQLKRTLKLSVITFIISSISMGMIYALTGMYPFGDKTILTMDMSGQYINYLAYFRNIFFDNASIFYDFSMNLGSNAYGLFAYYISSPLNIILCFFKQEHIIEAILCLNIIKIGLAGTTMAIYLLKVTKLKNYQIIALSVMYALMSYNIIYSQNIMWLDGVIYLPLVMLGLEKIIKEQKYNVYLIFLSLAIFSNFYIGYMIGVFGVLYFIANLVIKTESTNKKDYWKQFRKVFFIYCKASIFAILITAILLLPVGINLINSKADIQASNFEIDTYFNPLDALSKITIGAFSRDELVFGPPNIYCGSLSLLLCFTYFLNKNIKQKEKIVNFILMAIIILAFVLVPLNLVFHMLQSPVWFPFRYSFVFSFLMIVLASKNMEKGIELKILWIGQIVLSIIIALFGKLYPEYITNNNVVITILCLFILGQLYFYVNSKKDKIKKIFKIALIIFVCLEMIINGYQITNQISYVKREKFVNSYNKVNDIIQKYKSQENDFYRINSEEYRSINDSMLYHYNGFGHYSSTSGKANKDFLTDFGIRQNLITENASKVTLPMNSLLGIKYTILREDRVEDQNYETYEEIENNGQVKLLKNPYALSIGFMVNEQAKYIELEDNKPLENQNHLLKGITGIQEDAFSNVPKEEVSTIKEDENGITIEIQNENEKEYYIVYQLVNGSTKGVTIYVDGKSYVSASEVNAEASNVVYIPKETKNTIIKIDKESFKGFNWECYEFHPKVWGKMYDKLKTTQLDIEENKSHYLKGTIQVEESGLLLTSIINDKGWTVKIDGKSVEKQIIAENLIGIDIEKGEHTIEFVYCPEGFYIGMIITLIGIGLVVCDKVFFQNRKFSNFLLISNHVYLRKEKNRDGKV